MVNFGLNSASILGIFLAVAGAALYFLRSVRPELSRDHDIFFAAVGLLCGFILLFQGWRLDPILQFGQFLLTGSTIFFAVESIRLRKVATEQARRNTPTVDRDRPVSQTRVYREPEYDRSRERSIRDSYDNVYDGVAPNYDSPQLRGYQDPQPRPTRSRQTRDEEPRRRTPRNRPERPERSERYDNGTAEMRDAPARPRRPRNDAPRPSRRQENFSQWSQEENSWAEPGSGQPNARRDRPAPSRDPYNEPNVRDARSARPEPRRRPPADFEPQSRFKNEDLGRSYDSDLGTSYDEDMGDSFDDTQEEITTDYVDYQPMSDLGNSYEDDSDYDEEGDNPQVGNDSDWDDSDRRI